MQGFAIVDGRFLHERVSVGLVKACARVRGDVMATEVGRERRRSFMFHLCGFSSLQPLPQQPPSSNSLTQSHTNIPPAQSGTSLPLRKRSTAAALIQGKAWIFASIVVMMVGVLVWFCHRPCRVDTWTVMVMGRRVDQRGRWGWSRAGWGMAAVVDE